MSASVAAADTAADTADSAIVFLRAMAMVLEECLICKSSSPSFESS